MVRLTETIVLGRSRASDLSNVTKLNCWGTDLTDVSIMRKLPNIQIVSLSVNQINTLAEFSGCEQLEELYIRKNSIKDLSEILHLRSLKNLRSLWLSDNPCSDVENYRHTVLKTLPHLQKLDNIAVSSDDLIKAKELGTDLLTDNSEAEIDFNSNKTDKVDTSLTLPKTKETQEETIAGLEKSPVNHDKSAASEIKSTLNDNSPQSNTNNNKLESVHINLPTYHNSPPQHDQNKTEQIEDRPSVDTVLTKSASDSAFFQGSKSNLETESFPSISDKDFSGTKDSTSVYSDTALHKGLQELRNTNTLSWDETNEIRAKLGLRPLPNEQAPAYGDQSQRSHHYPDSHNTSPSNLSSQKNDQCRNSNLLQATLLLLKELDRDCLKVIQDTVESYLKKS